ncbi:hypothetical protein SSX86_024729 [Deinandra increscens subsp. villosa]|uniref:TIP49 P-loop domain-containing protein n=1 Tax=Deinandra increscens subsp. villosa TaxID=3103831 RepID=A0AAP0GN92_9ASTR
MKWVIESKEKCSKAARTPRSHHTGDFNFRDFEFQTTAKKRSVSGLLLKKKAYVPSHLQVSIERQEEEERLQSTVRRKAYVPSHLQVIVLVPVQGFKETQEVGVHVTLAGFGEEAIFLQSNVILPKVAAREADGLVDMVRHKKMAGRALLLVGPPGPPGMGKTALAFGVS